MTDENRVISNNENKENSLETWQKQINSKTHRLSSNNSTDSCEFNSIGIQCLISDEDLVTSKKLCAEYWFEMIVKRKQALANTIDENMKLHEFIDFINHENDMIRQESRDLLEMVDELNLIKVSSILLCYYPDLMGL
jgi:hypothetical protein